MIRSAVVMAGVAALAIGTLMLIGFMWVFGWGFFAEATAERRGEVAQNERVVADPDFRIASYQKFFNLCAAVQTSESAIENHEALLEQTTDASERQTIMRELSAMRTNRSKLINDYNSAAAQEDTAARFHASNLPHQLSASDEETTCAAPAAS